MEYFQPKFTSFSNFFQNDCTSQEKINDKINLLDRKILYILAENAYMTIPEIAKAVSKSEPTVHRHLNTLITENKIKRIGSRKNGYWKVL